MAHRVVALAIPDVILFDLAIPVEVFGRDAERGRYSFTVCTETPGAVSAVSGLGVSVERGLATLDTADTVIVPGFFPEGRPFAAGPRKPPRCRGSRGSSGIGLRGGVCASGGRSAGRADRHHSLGVRRRACDSLSRGQGPA